MLVLRWLQSLECVLADKKGGRDHECLSLGCDHEAVLAGRTPLQTYADFVAKFAAQCQAADLWGKLPVTAIYGSCALYVASYLYIFSELRVACGKFKMLSLFPLGIMRFPIHHCEVAQTIAAV